jgi:hypothetical protein
LQPVDAVDPSDTILDDTFDPLSPLDDIADELSQASLNEASESDHPLYDSSIPQSDDEQAPDLHSLLLHLPNSELDSSSSSSSESCRSSASSDSSDSSPSPLDERRPRQTKKGEKPCRLPFDQKELELWLACFLLVDSVAMSERAFKMMRGVMGMYKENLGIAGREGKLPGTLKTLRKIQGHLDTLQIFEHEVPIDQSKTQTGSRDSLTVKATSVTLESILSNLVMGNPKLRELLHFGPALYSTVRSELWQSPCWAGSVHLSRSAYPVFGGSRKSVNLLLD